MKTLKKRKTLRKGENLVNLIKKKTIEQTLMRRW
jgi:hypothetical protein